MRQTRSQTGTQSGVLEDLDEVSSTQRISRLLRSFKLNLFQTKICTRFPYSYF